MKAFLLGMGWVTPLGRGLEDVMAALQAGRTPEVHQDTQAPHRMPFPVWRVPSSALSDVAGLPRLRRSSAISHFAVAAAVDAASVLTPEQRARTALVFASTDGGVIYTRRFYADIVDRGPGAGSPLLFPETVYNAPASHIAARLGLAGESLTLVGDAQAGLDAIQTAQILLACGEADYCIIAAAQEIDWITCEAYTRWHMAGPSPANATLAEGGAAIVLGTARDGLLVQSVQSSEGQKSVAALASVLPRPPALVVTSNAGSALGNQEEAQLLTHFSTARHAAPKRQLGEAMAASSLQQIIFGALSMQNPEIDSVLTIATGFNHQISAVFLTHSASRA
jgi:hypothetical protein